MTDPDRAVRVRACDCPEFRYEVCDVCQCVTGVEAVHEEQVMTDETTARDRAIEVLTTGVRYWTEDPDLCDMEGCEEEVARHLVDALLANPEVLRALAAAPTADVAEAVWKPGDPVHPRPHVDLEVGVCEAIDNVFGALDDAARARVLGWATDRYVAKRPAAPEGVDAADEQARLREENLFWRRQDTSGPIHDERDTEIGNLRAELTAAQAAIQRVRAECDQAEKRVREVVEMCSGKKGADVPHWVGRIRRALDGDTTEEKR